VKAIIHKPTLTHKELSTLFWFNLFRALLVGSLLYLLSKPISMFFNTTDLSSVLIYANMTCFFIALGQVHIALLQKELRFFHFALCEILSMLSNTFASVILAFHGYGALAYILGSVIHQTLLALFGILFAFRLFIPSFSFSPKDLSFYLRFGMYQSGNFIFHYFTTQLDEFFIGRWFPLATYGIYSMGKRLPFRFSQLVNPVVTTTLLPLFSKIQRFPNRLQLAYLTTLTNLLSFTLIFYGFLFLFAKEVVLLFFGTGWEEVVPIIQLVAIWCAAKDFLYLTGLMIYVKGKTNYSFWWSLFSLLCFSSFFAIFVHTDMLYLLYGLIAIQVCLIPINWRFVLYPLIRVPFKPFLTHLLRPFVLVSLAIALTWVANDLLASFAPFQKWILSTFTFLFYLTSLFLFYRIANRNFITFFSQLIGFKKINQGSFFPFRNRLR
jgi:O-antigen/teichoic acid export membrane protein